MNKSDRQEILKQYKTAKENYLNNRTQENWIKYCNAKRNCMLLGIIL